MLNVRLMLKCRKQFEPLTGQGGNSAIETAAALTNHLMAAVELSQSCPCSTAPGVPGNPAVEADCKICHSILSSSTLKGTLDRDILCGCVIGHDCYTKEATRDPFL